MPKFLLLFLLLPLYLLGQNFSSDPTPKKPTLFGLRFKESPKSSTKALNRQGFLLIDQKNEDKDGIIKIFTFEGVPPSFGIQQGTTQLLFFKNKLTRVDFDLPPSYQNFISLRSNFFAQLDNRFELKGKKESMDPFLRTHLAHLKKKEFNKQAEKAIQESMAKGKTFFFYQLKDKKDQLNATFSFSFEKKPKLFIHYSEKKLFADLKKFQKKRKQLSLSLKNETLPFEKMISPSSDYP